MAERRTAADRCGIDGGSTVSRASDECVVSRRDRERRTEEASHGFLMSVECLSTREPEDCAPESASVAWSVPRDIFDRMNVAMALDESTSRGIVRQAIPISPAQVEIIDYEPNRVNLAVDTPAKGLLILTDTYMPGWKAFVDDQEAEIYIAYGRFPQAISFLQKAIETESDRADIQLKLLEVYVQTEDATAFNLQFDQLKLLGDDDATAKGATSPASSRVVCGPWRSRGTALGSQRSLRRV